MQRKKWWIFATYRMKEHRIMGVTSSKPKSPISPKPKAQQTSSISESWRALRVIITVLRRLGQVSFKIFGESTSELRTTSSDSKLKSHFSLTNYCVPFLWPMFEDFYIQRSAILLAFQRYQKFCYYQAPFSSNFHFSDTTPSWI